MKVYSDDPNLPYKTTRLKALYTKSEIDGLFAKWGVKDVYWRWDPEHNDVFVQFKIDIPLITVIIYAVLVIINFVPIACAKVKKVHTPSIIIPHNADFVIMF
ncbi:MAG: hypothetical protein QXU99_06515 [Candidatus Bathyarchaeia archaeon]